MRAETIHYSIFPASPEAHLFEVSCTVDSPDPAGQRFALPAWIPGSYMIREFARHIVRIEATSRGRRVALEKLDKHTWRAAPCAGPLTVTCEIYAWDLSVRAAHLDQSHGFFNGPSVFLRVLGQEDRPCTVDIRPPRGARYRRWRVATALARAGAREHGFGVYRAADYDDLIDHPVEMGTFTLAAFRACGVPHEIAITGVHDADLARLTRDLKRVCEWHIRFFGEPAPMDRYVFLLTVVGDGYGGLEHRASTALLASRADLPYRGMKATTEGYRRFLGLVSHEYFHTWNVKRIKPAAFAPYDLDRENYTRLLWAFEGFTSYYDDLALVRCGLIDAAQYRELVAKNIATVLAGSGRRKQSLAESSFDAWIKYYRQDENAPNAVASYYVKGALVGLALDLTIRTRTQGRRSLDDVMRALWRRYGKRGRGVGERDVERVADAVTGLRLGAFFRDAVYGTQDLPLARLLAQAGLDLKPKTGPDAVSLGVRTATAPDGVKLVNVHDGGAAQAAGLSAGDVMIAVDGLRVTHDSLKSLLARHRTGDVVQVHAFRRDELIARQVRLARAGPPQYELVEQARPKTDARRLRRRWLGA